ncbi:MAG TPA: hypothetical protein VEZ11_15185 [Thermoanaerobaculia bacterium]|nr:hypothetical protein [Thermoanaerobaculia bacterium]
MADEPVSDDSSAQPDGDASHVPEPQMVMPKWVPVLIGLILVLMAGLAVFTGMRYRRATLVNGIIKPRHIEPMSGGPPGEPAPGASLVFPGESGDNVPLANPPVSGTARAEISGGKTGVTASVRFWARRGMLLAVTPSDAMVFVNDLAIGEANQFATGDEIYDFPAAGSYFVRVSAPGYKERQYVITASPDAKLEIARIEAKLEKEVSLSPPMQ